MSPRVTPPSPRDREAMLLTRLGLTAFLPDSGAPRARKKAEKFEPVLVSEWRRNAREVIRVRLDSYQGTPVFDIRTWYQSGDELKPGRSGITLSISHLATMADALVKAVEEANSRGLLGAPPLDPASPKGPAK